VKHKGKNPDLSELITFFYPAFLNLNKRKVVVCGGGKVAERKIIDLIKTGADITVISPELTKRIEKEKQKDKIKHIHRHYREGDLQRSFLVIAATDSPHVNEKISEDADCLVNVVDTPHLCNFIVPSTVNRWPLTIAVSTSGVSPALSRAIRKEIEKICGPEFSKYLKLLKKYRILAMNLIKDKRKRRSFLQDVASEKVIGILRRKGLKEAEKVVKDLFEKAKNI
jgi:precorrin-2 dehydrogenase / sirohydrochlorin ferrochelatase